MSPCASYASASSRTRLAEFDEGTQFHSQVVNDRALIRHASSPVTILKFIVRPA
jgi:hypothetical protein